MPDSTPTRQDKAEARPARSRGRRMFFTTFKWCRITFLLFVFVIVVLGLFLNHVGLPDWVEARLLKTLQEQGWEVNYSRLRLRWYHGVVAENLQLWRTNATAGPHLFLPRAEFRPRWSSLPRLQVEFDGVALEDGRLIWPLPLTNRPTRNLVLNNLGGELLFKPGDRWELTRLEAMCLGTLVRIRGDITNASLIREWKLPRPTKVPERPPGEAGHRLLTELEKIHFRGQPSAQVIVSGDAQNWRAFDISVRLTAPGVESPWGGGDNVTTIARTVPPTATNDPVRLALHITAEESRTRWADAAQLDLKLQLEPSLEHLLPTNGTLSAQLVDARAEWGRARQLSIFARGQPEGLQAQERITWLDVTGDRLETRWGNAERLTAMITARHGPTNYLPARTEIALQSQELRTAWLTSHWARVEGRLELPSVNALGLFDSNRVWLDRITNLPFAVSATVSNAVVEGLVLDRATTSVDWRMPAARVSLSATSGESSVVTELTGNAATGELVFTNATALRPAAFARFLSTNAQRWLATFESERAPSIVSQGRLLLPTWAHWPDHWQAEVLPTLQLQGRLDAPAVSYQGIAIERAQVPFALSNEVWQFTDLRLERSEGALRLDARAEELTGRFEIDLVSEINPLALKPALTNAAGVFEMFTLSNQPPRIEAHVAGNRRDLSSLSGQASLFLTNATFRGVPVQGLTARLAYTNQWLAILQPVLIREGERGTADGIGINFAHPRLHLTNASGRISSLALGQAIGPITKRTLEPYVFEVPPDARADGSIPLGGIDRGTEDMRFEVDGGKFHWNVLHFDRLKGTALWRGDELTLTNITGLWHGGSIKGWAHFDFEAPRGGSMEFDATFNQCALKPIVRDFQRGRSNSLDGTITGRMRVTKADVNRLNSWHGDGHIELKEGLIWDIPLFGLISPVLNTMIPGLGNSRAKEGQATFTMTNSVIHSRDLEIVANATRLRYDGSVDFDGNVAARLEAELMREIPGIGRIISTVLWPVTKLLRYSVSGTLSNPKLEPTNPIATILTLPLKPFQVINDLLTPEKKEKEKEKEPEPGK